MLNLKLITNKRMLEMPEEENHIKCKTHDQLKIF